MLPTFVVTGTSGAGKTTVTPLLHPRLPGCFVFETDALLSLSAHGWDVVYNACLLVARMAIESGRMPVLLGTLVPDKVDACPARTALGDVHYLNLHCSDEERRARLTARPPWRRSSSVEMIEEHRLFARWLLDESGLPMIDTTAASPDETADAVAEWVQSLC